jgi:hypothetical protein
MKHEDNSRCSPMQENSAAAAHNFFFAKKWWKSGHLWPREEMFQENAL